MAGVEVGPADGAADEEWYGVWTVLGDPDNECTGTLRVKPGGMIELTLSGGFPDADDLPRRIVGRIGGDWITLTGARCVGTKMQGERLTQQTWSGFEFFKGTSQLRDEAPTFDFVQLETYGLEQWIDDPESLHPDFDEYLASAGYRLPERLTFTTPSGIRLTIGWYRGKEVHGRRRHSVEIYPALVVELKEPVDLDTIWTQVISPLVLFLVLSTGDPDRVRRIHLGGSRVAADDARMARRYFEWFQTTWRGKPGPAASAYGGEHLIPFHMFRNRLPRLIADWLGLYAQVTYPLLEFFLDSVYDARGMFDEEFARIVRCMEVYHRFTQGGTYMAEDDFADLVGRLKRASTTPEERTFVSMRMGYANELTLKQRLDAMIARAGDLLQMEVRSKPSFTRRVVDTRNSIAHKSTLGEAFPLLDMLEARDVLRRVFRANILRDLGFSDDEIHQALIRTPEYVRGGRTYRI